ncbi:MAG TPA: hypothetical protein DCL15_16960 [Chloroflexi bacterium]|nr:hypothetical protein [Chloroflexota bacterium]HHW85263.1 LysM peptidoglycan-binding domain-containing protein [Chloroflexota bacterium]
MNRRQLALVIILNALISLTIAVAVVWVVEQRRPDPEALAALATPITAPVMAATFTPTSVATTPVPAEATSVATPAPNTEEVYVVQAGDSLLAIAGRYGVSMQAIMDANNLTNPDFVFSGQRLVIPRADAAPSAAPSPTAAPPAIAGQGLRIASFTSNGALPNEAVQLANDSDLVINLQGWRLEKAGGPAYTFGGLSLFPGSGLVLYTGAGVDTSVALYWNQTSPLWERGSVARLINPQGQEVSQLTAP